MPDSTPNIHETEIAKALGLALASLYLPAGKLGAVEKGSIALNALFASLRLVNVAKGRPEGWRPSAEGEWATFIAELDAEIAAEEAKIAALPEPPPANP
jgi:hypothetical protein